MDNQSNRKAERPLWVRVGLWGLHSRTSAWAFLWLAVALAIGSVFYGVTRDSRFIVGAVFFLAALWYWLAIQWVDRHGSWK